MYGSSWDRGCFTKKFCLTLFYIITQELEELQRCNDHDAYGFIGKYAVMKCHQLLSKIAVSIHGKTRFDQLAIAAFSTPFLKWNTADIVLPGTTNLP